MTTKRVPGTITWLPEKAFACCSATSLPASREREGGVFLGSGRRTRAERYLRSRGRLRLAFSLLTTCMPAHRGLVKVQSSPAHLCLLSSDIWGLEVSGFSCDHVSKLFHFSCVNGSVWMRGCVCALKRAGRVVASADNLRRPQVSTLSLSFLPVLNKYIQFFVVNDISSLGRCQEDKPNVFTVIHMILQLIIDAGIVPTAFLPVLPRPWCDAKTKNTGLDYNIWQLCSRMIFPQSAVVWREAVWPASRACGWYQQVSCGQTESVTVPDVPLFIEPGM